MKKIILLILIAFGSVALRAQQTIPLQKTATLKVKDGKTENRQNVFGVFGVGNLNKE